MRKRMEEVTDRLQRTSEDLDVTVRLTRVDVFHFYGLGFNRILSFDVFRGRRRGGSLRSPRHRFHRGALAFPLALLRRWRRDDGKGGGGGVRLAFWRLGLAHEHRLDAILALLHRLDKRR